MLINKPTGLVFGVETPVPYRKTSLSITPTASSAPKPPGASFPKVKLSQGEHKNYNILSHLAPSSHHKAISVNDDIDMHYTMHDSCDAFAAASKRSLFPHRGLSFLATSVLFADSSVSNSGTSILPPSKRAKHDTHSVAASSSKFYTCDAPVIQGATSSSMNDSNTVTSSLFIASTSEGQSSPRVSGLPSSGVDCHKGTGKSANSSAVKERIARNKAAAMAKRAARANKPTWHIKSTTDAHFDLGDNGVQSSVHHSPASSSFAFFASDAPVISSFASNNLADSAASILPPCKRARHLLQSKATPTTEARLFPLTSSAKRQTSLAPVAETSVAACGSNAPT